MWGVIILALLLSWFLREMFLIFGLKRSAKKLHMDVTRSVVNSPQSFFDTTPMGRILNRFSRDLYMSDLEMPNLTMQWVRIMLQVTSWLIMVSLVTYYLPLIIIPCVYLYGRLGVVYSTAARELQRMETITRSGIAQCFTEAVTGIATIRAFKKENLWLDKSDGISRTNHRYFYNLRLLAEWFSIRISWLTAIIAASCVMMLIVQKDSVSPRYEIHDSFRLLTLVDSC